MARGATSRRCSPTSSIIPPSAASWSTGGTSASASARRRSARATSTSGARARDQALASTRAKSMFLANMSHEVRTPMNVIIGMTDMVLDTELASAQRANLERVRAAAIGLLAIINDILDASKIEAGKMTVEAVDMDLRRTIEEAAGLLVPAATAKGLALTCMIAPDVPAQLMGDPVRVRQTLVNLVGNAVKFTDAGAITAEARGLRRASSHVVVGVSVTEQ